MLYELKVAWTDSGEKNKENSKDALHLKELDRERAAA